MIDVTGNVVWQFWTELSEFNVQVYNPYQGGIVPEFISLVPVGETAVWTFILDPTDGNYEGPDFVPEPGTYVLQPWTPPPMTDGSTSQVSIGWPGMVQVS